MYCVYKHTAPNQKVYIGITKQVAEKRWGNGSGYVRSPHFYNAINKYGWENFSHEILIDELSKEEAGFYEQYYIQVYKSYDSRFGYNSTTGGELSFEFTEEVKTKMRLAKLGKPRGSMSEEHKRKISEAKKGKAWTEAEKEKAREWAKSRAIKVEQLDIDGNLMQVYSSIIEAERVTGVRNCNIVNCCKGRQKTSGGYKWRIAI